MGWKIPDDTIQEIRDRVSIVEVISGYLSLKRSGRNHTGLCPFHDEKTPSFSVNDERGFYYCFGCGKGGDVFKFLQEIERVSFPDAAEMLARRAGIALPERTAEAGPGEKDREHMLQISEWAARKFTAALAGSEGEAARHYLSARGVSPEITRLYGLGFAPASGDFLVRMLGGRRAALESAVKAGLVARRDSGGHYDRFRGRLMFPICDKQGRIVAFGGRVLDDGQPKYLNSPESPLFRKGRLVYGLPQARQAIRESDRVVVVEGYMDVLALVQHGVGNVVATLGTALTWDHLKFLLGYAQEIVVFFDGDDAGKTAATRAFAISKRLGAKGAFLPPKDDPDSYVRREGADAVRALLDRAVPLEEFYLDELRARTGTSVSDRARAAEEFADTMAQVESPVERDLLIRKASERLGVSEEAIRAAASRKERRTAPPPQPSERLSSPPAEILLLEIMAIDADVAQRVAERGTIEKFTHAELADCARRIATAWEKGERAVSGLMDTIPDPIASRLIAALMGADGALAEARRKQAGDCVARIEKEAARRTAEATLQELRRAEASGDEERARELLQRAQNLARRREGVGV